MTHFSTIWNLWFLPIECFSSHSFNFVTKDGDVNVSVQKLIIWHQWIMKVGIVMRIDISWNSFCSFASLSLIIKRYLICNIQNTFAVIPQLLPRGSWQVCQNFWISYLKSFLWTQKITFWNCFVTFLEIWCWSKQARLNFAQKTGKFNIFHCFM